MPHVQTIKTIDNDGGPSVTSGSITVTAGNALIAVAVAADNVSTPSVSNIKLDGTTSFRLDKSVTDTSFSGTTWDGNVQIGILENVSGGAHTVTVTYAANVAVVTLFVMEVSGLVSTSSLDGAGGSFVGNATGTTAATAVFQNTQPNSFRIMAAGTAFGTTGATVTPLTGWTTPTNGSELNGSVNQVAGVAYIDSPDATTGIGRFTVDSGERTMIAAVCYKCSASLTTQEYYHSLFPTTENPISESGKWRNGAANGVNWTNCRVTSGEVYGTQSGSAGYDDSIAVLGGQWLDDQVIVATVKTINQTLSWAQEIELFVRGSISPGCLTGYEVQFSCRGDALSGSSYVNIVRWNGALGDWTPLGTTVAVPLNDGDVIKATMTGSTVKAFRNGTEIRSEVDTTYTRGQPGVGFFSDGGHAASADFGILEWQFGTEPVVNPMFPASRRVPLQYRRDIFRRRRV